MPWSRLLVRAALLLSAAAIALPSHAADMRSQGDRFEGVWVLNKDLSADPAGSLEGPRRRGGGRMPVGGQGGGLGGPGGGGVTGPLIGGRAAEGGPDPQELALMRETLRMAMDVPERMTVSVEGLLVTLAAGEDVQQLRADGKKVTERTGTGLELDRKTKWDDEELVTEFSVKKSGGKAKQRWTREGARLVILTEIESSTTPDTLVVKRVYDLEGAEHKP